MPRLAGHRPLLTRSVEDAAAWAEALASEGAKPILLPCIETETIAEVAMSQVLADSIRAADWLVFTSRRGVDALAGILSQALPDGISIAAVGQATAERFRATRAGAAPGREIVIGQSTGAALGRELAKRPDIAGSRFVLAIAENAGDALADALTGAGARVERFDVYRTIPTPAAEPKRDLSTLDCTTVIFASPSAVTGFDNQVNIDTGLQTVTIGPSTSAAVRALDWPVTAEAREPSINGIIESMLETQNV